MGNRVEVKLRCGEYIDCCISSYYKAMPATRDEPSEPAEIEFSEAYCNGSDLVPIWDLLGMDIQREIQLGAIAALEADDE